MTPRDILIVNGTVVTGDGSTVHEMGSILIRNGRIADVTPGRLAGPLEAEIIDASGCVILPGIVNGHAHACTFGPAMPSGSLPFLLDDVEYYRNRHLTAGTTTLLNVCGLALHHEIEPEFPGNGHPLDVFISTAHTPSNIAAADAVDGKGLSDQHRMVTLEDMILAGARVLGEAGGGQTLGGGAQEYRFIPDAISAKTGSKIHPNLARRFKEAIVGRHLDLSEPDAEAVEALIEEGGLGGTITVMQMTKLVTETVMPPVALSFKGFVEIADACQRFSLAGIFHNAAPTAALICALATSHPKARIIAAHSNHPSFTPEESLKVATTLKERGAVIDVSTLDCISTRWRNGPENLDALMSAGLVDTISTDFAGGDWDGILEALQRSVLLGQRSLAQAIALGTGNVSKVLPEIAGDRGLLEKGRRADVVISARHNLSRVRHVLKNGRPVVSNGL